eukprot:scaffold100305_cov27-Phaeocystis_antarctica.AAC.1
MRSATRHCPTQEAGVASGDAPQRRFQQAGICGVFGLGEAKDMLQQHQLLRRCAGEARRLPNTCGRGAAWSGSTGASAPAASQPWDAL